MKRKLYAIPALVLCMTVLVISVVPVYAAETVTLTRDEFLSNLGQYSDDPVLADRSYNVYLTGETDESGVIYYKGIESDTTVKFCPIRLTGTGFSLSILGNDSLYSDEIEYNPPGSFTIREGTHACIVEYAETCFILTYLSNGEVFKKCRYYYKLPDGTTSYYLEHPEEKPQPEPEPEPGPQPPAGETPDILESANTFLAFSVSILSAVAENPVLSFILAGQLVIICVYVLTQVKKTARDT